MSLLGTLHHLTKVFNIIKCNLLFKNFKSTNVQKVLQINCTLTVVILMLYLFRQVNSTVFFFLVNEGVAKLKRRLKTN